jgi:hypothetical protein
MSCCLAWGATLPFVTPASSAEMRAPASEAAGKVVVVVVVDVVVVVNSATVDPACVAGGDSAAR